MVLEKSSKNEFSNDLNKTAWKFSDGFTQTVCKTIILEGFENRLEKNQLESAIFFFFCSVLCFY
jgi:hypothetical protein